MINYAFYTTVLAIWSTQVMHTLTFSFWMSNFLYFFFIFLSLLTDASVQLTTFFVKCLAEPEPFHKRKALIVLNSVVSVGVCLWYWLMLIDFFHILWKQRCFLSFPMICPLWKKQSRLSQLRNQPAKIWRYLIRIFLDCISLIFQKYEGISGLVPKQVERTKRETVRYHEFITPFFWFT